MRFRSALPLLAILAAPVAVAQTAWQRYTNAGLSAEFPAEPDRFDKWTDIAKGRVIQMDRFVRDSAGDMQAYFFVQAVIADKPYDVDAKLKEEIAQRSGGDAAVSSTLVSHRALRADEMILPGMKGVETVTRYGAFGGNSDQIEISHSMYVGNKWLAVSVRHFEGDKRWPAERLFKSVRWNP